MVDLSYNRFMHSGWRTRIIFLAILFAIIWTVIVYPNLDAMNNLPHWMQFMVSIGVILFMTYFLGSALDGHPRRTIAIFCALLALDLLLFPLVVSREGIPADVDMSGAAVEVITLDVWSSLGIPGSLRWLFTYPISFVLLLILAAYLFESEREARGSFSLGGS